MFGSFRGYCSADSPPPPGVSCGEVAGSCTASVDTATDDCATSDGVPAFTAATEISKCNLISLNITMEWNI